MIANSSSAVMPENLSAEQIAEATRYLMEMREALLESTEGLSAEQWYFKPVPDRWSIGEIVEHVVIIEQRIHGIVEKIRDAPEPPADWDQTNVDALVLREIPNRSQRFKGPAFACPTQRWSSTEALEHFCNAREGTIQLLSGSSLRGHVIPHPLAGPWDGYQWILAAGAHGARHTEQIREVKTGADFPRS